MRFKVGLEILGTRPSVVQCYDADLTATPTGTSSFEVSGDVSSAPDMAVVARDTVADLHPSVASATDDDDLVEGGASSVECLPFAVLGLRRCTVTICLITGSCEL